MREGDQVSVKSFMVIFFCWVKIYSWFILKVDVLISFGTVINLRKI